MSDVYSVGEESCNHPFDLLSTTEDRFLYCAGCESKWPTSDADSFEVMFLSVAIKISTQDDKIVNLEQFISSNFGTAICANCDLWVDSDDPETGFKLSNIWTCVDHISVTASYLDDKEIYKEIIQWAENADLFSSLNIRKKFILEELISSLPGLYEEIIEKNIEIEDRVIIDHRLVHELGLTIPITINDLIKSILIKLDIEKGLEEIKFSRSFLLGIISGADSWLRGDIVIDDHLDEDFQSEADSIYKKIAELSLPPVQLSRIKTYVEINSDNMPDVFTVDGDLVDQLLLMTAARGAESILKNIYNYEEN
jgi:hypothetical protein